MPMYEYQCQKCDTVMEVMQTLKEDKLTTHQCTKCNSEQSVKKIITSMNFQLLGRGWEADGYDDTYKQTLDMV